MNKEIISTKQGICIMVLFCMGSSIVVGIGNDAKQDIWIAMLIALLMCLPMIYIYSKLLTIFPGKDLYDVLQEVFGKFIGKLISLIYVWYSFHLGALIIRNFSEFVQVMSLPETPQYIIIFLYVLLCIWCVKSGIEVLGRWSSFTFPIVIIIIITLLILSLSKVNLLNLKPVLYDGMKPVLSSAFAIFSFPFAETVVFTMVFNTLKQTNKTFKVFFISSLISFGILILIFIRNILILGVAVSNSLYFPSYVAVRTINISEFLQRFEVLVAVIFMFAGFVKISVCLLAASKGVAKIFNIEKSSQIVAPIGLLMMNLACIVYNSTFEMVYFASEIYKYYAIPFQIILPLFILIAAKIKVHSNKVKNKAC